MSTPQEYWDMALVKAWRAEQTIGDAIKLFESITGLKLADIQPRLLRTPVGYVKFKMGTRAYVSAYLMDINDWFWSCAPGKEVELFKRITASKRDVSRAFQSNGDKEKESTRKHLVKDAKRNKAVGQALSFGNRNRSTDWNVTK